MGDKPISLGAFARDLRWLLPLSVATTVTLWALDVKGMRDLGFVPSVLLGVGFVFVLGPIVWLRFERFGSSGKAFWKFWVFAVLWVFVALGIVMVGLDLAGVD